MALYNDERPKRFGEVLGQELVVKQMKRKLAEGRFPQTVLATGPRGTGKTTCSRIIAKALNCENPREDGEPCCECASCKAIDTGVSPSVVELDAATNNGVDDVRSLVEQSKFAPVGKKMVFILDEVHMFSTAAWNALLKTLEEPPKDVIFILATTELQKVPVTVLSRCLRFEFQKISRETMSNYIFDLCKKYEIGIEPGALSLIVTQAEGCMRDALSLLEQFIGCEELETETVLDFLGLASDDVIFDVLMGMCKGDAKASIDVIEDCENRGKSILSIVRSILEALTHAAGYKSGGVLPAQSEEYKGKLIAFADSVSESKLNQITGTFLQVYPMLQKNAQLTFLLKAAIVNIVSSESLLSRLEAEVTLLKERPVAAVVEPHSVAVAQQECTELPKSALETSKPVEECSKPASEFAIVKTDVVAFPTSVEPTAPVVASNETTMDFEEIPDFPDADWDNYDTGFESGLFEDGQCSPFDEEAAQEPVVASVTPTSPTVSLSTDDKKDSESVEQTTLVDGAGMSMEELMAAMESGSLGGESKMPTNVVPFRPAASAEMEENDSKKEDTPASVEDEMPQFEAFNFFLAGGSARL